MRDPRPLLWLVWLATVIGLLAGCAAPKPIVPPPVVVTRVVTVTVPVAAATTIPVAAPRVADVLRDSAAVEAQATSYVHGPHPKAPIIDTLTALTTRINATKRALVASRRHGHYGVAQMRDMRAALDALATFMSNMGPG